MPKTIRRTVAVMDPATGNYTTYYDGDEVSDELAETITNPKVFEALPGSDTDDDVPDGLTLETANAAAQVNALSPDENSSPNTGAQQYEDMNVTDLRKEIRDRGLDLGGATRKSDLVAILMQDDQEKAAGQTALDQQPGGTPLETGGEE